MEFQKSLNLLDITSDNKDLSRNVTKKWIEVYYQSETNYHPNKKIGIKTPMLRSDLCDFSDAYIVVKGDKIADKITFIGKPKEKTKEKPKEIYIPPEKRQQIIDDFRLF